MKKYLLILFFFFMIATCFSQEYWIHKPSPTSRWLTRITFVDTLYGWAAGDSGTVVHTTDGGLNWAVQNSGILNYPIDDIFFIDRNFGWGVANDFFFFGTKMMRTTNGGINWQVSVYPDTTQVFNTIYFLNSQTGFLSGYTGNIFKTTDSGDNWFQTHVDSGSCAMLYLFPKWNLNFFDGQTGYACGGQIDIQGIIWKTTDSGLNWFTYCLTPEPLRRIEAISQNKILATGGDYEYGAMIVQSFDTGNNWNYDNLGLFGTGTSIAFRTPSELWLPLSFAQKWAVSVDSGSPGSNWYEINSPDSSAVWDAVFMTPSFGWACGTSGALLKYNAEVIGIGHNPNVLPLNSSLYQNYPNPFNPSTTISYYLVKPENVVISVYDITGKEVQRYIEGSMNSGTHKLKISSDRLASGVYFYRITAGDFVQSKKMVILK